MVLVDRVFFLIFALTSLVYWIPVLLVLFVPFILLRRVKRKISNFALVVENFSNQKLGEFRAFKKMTEVGGKVERKGKRFYNNFTNKAYQKTVWWQRMEIIEAVSYKAKVLDIGCGNGYLAQVLAKNKKAEVTCLDIADFNQTEIPTILFDGVNLPFADREFDVVILSYVLHHSEFAEELLLEAARVCRGKVIIYEDETMAGAEEIMAAAHGKIWKFLTDQEGKITYHTPKEWLEIFDRHNLEVLEEKREWGISSLMIPLKKAIFVLKSKN